MSTIMTTKLALQTLRMCGVKVGEWYRMEDDGVLEEHWITDELAFLEQHGADIAQMGNYDYAHFRVISLDNVDPKATNTDEIINRYGLTDDERHSLDWALRERKRYSQKYASGYKGFRAESINPIYYEGRRGMDATRKRIVELLSPSIKGLRKYNISWAKIRDGLGITQSTLNLVRKYINV